MTLSEFDTRLAAAKEANRVRRKLYAKNGEICPVKCSPFCGVLHIRNLICAGIGSDNLDLVIQALATAENLLTYWEANNYHYDRCTHSKCGRRPIPFVDSK